LLPYDTPWDEIAKPRAGGDRATSGPESALGDDALDCDDRV